MTNSSISHSPYHSIILACKKNKYKLVYINTSIFRNQPEVPEVPEVPQS